MIERRSLSHLRHPSRDMTAVSVAQHRQSPAGPRNIGWAVTSDATQARFVEIDGNGDWVWTTTRRNAELFLTKATADRWIARNLSGVAEAVVLKR